jgi:hypothetical protein
LFTRAREKISLSDKLGGEKTSIGGGVSNFLLRKELEQAPQHVDFLCTGEKFACETRHRGKNSAKKVTKNEMSKWRRILGKKVRGFRVFDGSFFR